MRGEPGVAAMIVPTPEVNFVMIAYAPDQMIYFYVGSNDGSDGHARQLHTTPARHPAH